MDDDDDVVCIEAPVASTASTPHRVKRNGGAVRVRFNGEGSKAASSRARSGKFKEQGRAPRQYVRCKDWTVVRRYVTGGRAQLDSEDIEFDIYQRARDLMHLSGLRLLPEQVLPESNVHLWQLVRQATTAMNGAAIRQFACPMRHLCKCKAGLRIVEGPGFMQLERFGLHDQHSHEIPPPPQFNASLQDNDFSPAPSYPDDSDAEDDAVDDEDDDEDDDDDGDSGDDNERDAGVDGQLSVHEGVLHKD